MNRYTAERLSIVTWVANGPPIRRPAQPAQHGKMPLSLLVDAAVTTECILGIIRGQLNPWDPKGDVLVLSFLTREWRHREGKQLAQCLTMTKGEGGSIPTWTVGVQSWAQAWDAILSPMGCECWWRWGRALPVHWTLPKALWTYHLSQPKKYPGARAYCENLETCLGPLLLLVTAGSEWWCAMESAPSHLSRTGDSPQIANGVISLNCQGPVSPDPEGVLILLMDVSVPKPWHLTLSSHSW
jgi:hypothetical protein